jgi:site-specific DNA-methyltransferase (adenine-specific)
MIVCELIEGDCCEVMAYLPEKSFDACVTSPPYNLGIKYTKYNDARAVPDYLTWCRRWINLVNRVLKDSGSFFLNLGGSPSQPWLPFDVAAVARQVFVLQNTFHWIKAITVGTQSHGHFKPVNSKRYVTDCHEFVFHFTKHGTAELDRLAIGVQYTDKSNIKRWKHTGGADLRCRGNAWYAPYKTIKSRAKQRPHPATFSVELAENCIKICSARSIIDQFVGIGTTGAAAARCGADRFVGIDIDGGYIKTARERLNESKIQCLSDTITSSNSTR